MTITEMKSICQLFEYEGFGNEPIEVGHDICYFLNGFDIKVDVKTQARLNDKGVYYSEDRGWHTYV